MTTDAKPPARTDIFAEIAARRHAARGELLIEPQPPVLPEGDRGSNRGEPRLETSTNPDESGLGSPVVLALQEPGDGKGSPSPMCRAWGPPFTPAPKLDTAEALRAELGRMRHRYAPFLRNLAPALESLRVTVPIETFDWRIETPTYVGADRADLAGVLKGDGDWERVRIPHYGGPLGRAVTYYRTTFQVTEAMRRKGALFLRFGGVDYRAHVFVNGNYLGSHEGFFASFEFECTGVARAGTNTLLVKVENDAICMGNDSWGDDGRLYEGDKIYAATGPGYDDPEVGWHHCPPGMGIYQAVALEARAPLHVRDLFVRPLSLEGQAEAWIEVWNCHRTRQDAVLSLSVYGQNFQAAPIQGLRVEQKALGPGVNYLRVPLTLTEPKVWEPQSPWLYQLQATVQDGAGASLDTAARQFGLRTFRMEEDQEPKGRFYLNGRPIRLRGANTMGFEQQDVMKGDFRQLLDDILLAKIANMNFWRLTQRPVQAEVYEYCDRLGLMTQTDLPLFGCLRRNQFCEAVRQAEEMERLVRGHPCNIMLSYVNEPVAGGMGKPHRHLMRDELERFFLAADQAVRIANPDRVIKAVDGDYDPPAPGFPDNHCYCGWYNGHGVDLGRLHRGYWQAVKPGWCYGCGEFGAEGLDPVETMRKYYPPAWLPRTAEEEASPDRIVKAQTGRFHYLWFETQHRLDDWVRASQRHQAWVTRLMTEAFRRDSRMTSCAIHLFIDAFPSGWMKAIMDVDRNPKPAYFAYRDALTPLMVNLRTDRFAWWAGEEITLEAWICNDLPTAPAGAELRCQFEVEGQVRRAGRVPAVVPACSSAFQCHLRIPAPSVAERATATVRLALVAADGRLLHDGAVDLEIFPRPAPLPPRRVCLIGHEDGPAARLAAELGITPQADTASAEVFLVDDVAALLRQQPIVAAVQRGATAVLLALPEGEHAIAGSTVTVTPCGMGARHFVSRATGHPLVAGFGPEDFRFWHDPKAGHATPFLHATFTAPGWTAILASGNGGWAGEWHPALAAAEKADGPGLWRICLLDLSGRTSTNPIAACFARRLLTRA